jgi:hypothetical protein
MPAFKSWYPTALLAALDATQRVQLALALLAVSKSFDWPTTAGPDGSPLFCMFSTYAWAIPSVHELPAWLPVPGQDLLDLKSHFQAAQGHLKGAKATFCFDLQVHNISCVFKRWRQLWTVPRCPSRNAPCAALCCVLKQQFACLCQLMLITIVCTLVLMLTVLEGTEWAKRSVRDRDSIGSPAVMRTPAVIVASIQANKSCYYISIACCVFASGRHTCLWALAARLTLPGSLSTTKVRDCRWQRKCALNEIEISI